MAAPRSRPGRALSYQLAGAHGADDAHVHPEAVGEGRLQVDAALPVVLWQLAHVRPIRVLDGPQLNLIGALRGPSRQPGKPGQRTRAGSRARRPAPCLPFLGADNSLLPGGRDGRHESLPGPLHASERPSELRAGEVPDTLRRPPSSSTDRADPEAFRPRPA